MNQNKVAVIVSRCVQDRIYGDRLVDATLPNVEEALKVADPLRAEGKSVIVRPNYNEKDSDGTYFREWRSFNGAPFKEIRFAYG